MSRRGRPSVEELADALSPGAALALRHLAPPCRYPLSALKAVGVELHDLQELSGAELGTMVGFWHATPRGLQVREELLARADPIWPWNRTG